MYNIFNTVLETPHVVVGAVIATKVVNPALSIPLAFASHFVLEQIPHWNPHLNTEKTKLGKVSSTSTKIVILDSTLAIIFGSIIALRALPNIGLMITIYISCLAASTPDLIEAPFYFLNMNSKFLEKWIKFQKSMQVDTTPFWGLLTQVVTVIAAFLWIL